VPRGSNGTWDGGANGLDADGTHIFYGWIERLADAASWGETAPASGCAPTTYCPGQVVTRAQMAKFLVVAFGMTR
jgi:hypothetical protein